MLGTSTFAAFALASALATTTVSAEPIATTSANSAAMLHDLSHAIGETQTLSLVRAVNRVSTRASAWLQPEVDELVQWHVGARDLLHSAVTRITAMSIDIAPPPDVSVLTTSPIAAMTAHQSSGFGWRDDPIRHDTRYHSGTDFRSPYGTPVLAAGDGIVAFAGQQSGYGNVVYVEHGGGITTRYAHLRKIDVKKNAAITAGEQLGEVGSTGRATGPHLHFEVRIDGHAVSPILAMSVAELERDNPASGRIAAYSLSPELAKHAQAEVDHPRGAQVHKTQESRPERAGRTKRAVPTS